MFEHLQFINEIIDILTSQGKQISVLDKLCQIIRDKFAVDLVEIWKPSILMDKPTLIGCDYNVKDGESKKYIKDSINFDFSIDTFKEKSYMTQKHVGYYNLHTDKHVLIRQQLAIKAGFESVIIVAIFTNKNVAALLCVYSKSHMQYEADKALILEVVSKQLSTYLDNEFTQNFTNDYLNNTTELVCITNEHYTIEKCSASFLDIMQMPKPRIIGESFVGLEHPARVFSDKVLEKLKLGEKHIFQTKYFVKKEIFYVNWITSYLIHEKKFIFSGQDVSDKINSELILKEKTKALQKANQEFTALLSGIKEVMFSFDKNAEFIDVTENIEDVLGYTKETLIGRSVFTMLHVDDFDKLELILISDFKTKNSFKDITIRLKHKKGNWIWISVSGQTIFNDEGLASHIIGFAKDISAKMALEEDLNIQVEKYGRLFLQQPHALLVYDLKTNKILEANAACCKLYEYTREELLTLAYSTIAFGENETLYGKAVQKNTINENGILKTICEHKAKTGKRFVAEVNKQQFFNGKNLVAIVSISDISESIAAKSKLEQSEIFYKRFVENNQDSICSYELKVPTSISRPVDELVDHIYNYSFIADCNEVYIARVGVPKNLIIGQLVRNVWGNLKPDFKDILRRIISNQFQLNQFSIESASSNGTKTNFLTTFTGIIDNDQLISVWSISKEVTENVVLKQKLETVETKYNSIIQNNQDSIFRFEAKREISLNSTIEEIKDGMLNHLQISEYNIVFHKRYAPSESVSLLGLGLKSFFEASKLDFSNGAGNFIKNNFSLHNYEHVLFDAFGNKLSLVTNLIGEIVEEKLVGVWGFTKDITKVKLVEREKELSELKYTSFIQNSNDSIYCYSLDKPMSINLSVDEQIEYLYDNLYLTDCNEAMAKRNGYKSSKHILGKKLNELNTTKNYDNEKALREFVQNNYRIENRVRSISITDEMELTISLSSKAVIENGYLKRVWGIARDITNEIRENKKNNFLARIINNVTDAIYTCNEDLVILSWNNAAEKIYGLLKEEVIGKSIADFFVMNYEIDSKENLLKQVDKLGKWVGEVDFIRPNDKKRVTLLSTIDKSIEKNNAVYIVTSKDITDRKVAEANLQESERRFRTFANNAPAMFWVGDKFGETIFYNKFHLDFLGVTEKEAILLKWEDKVHPDDAERTLLIMNTALLEQKPIDVEYRLKRYDGEYRWVLDRKAPRFLDNGDFIGYIGICVDINERKEMLNALQESEARFRDMANAAPVMIWMTNEFDVATYYSNGWLNVTGNSILNEMKTPWIEKVHPEDRDAILKKYDKNLHTQKPFVLEYRLKTKFDKYVWILDKGSPRYLSDGQFIGYIRVCIDIEHLKNQEEQLRIFNDRYSFLNEASNEAIWDADVVTNVTVWGTGYTKLFGYKDTVVSGESWLYKVHPDDLEDVKGYFFNLEGRDLKKDNVFTYEFRFLKADGTYAMVKIVSYAIIDKEGNIVRLVGSMKDITRQKELEEKLMAAENERQIQIKRAMIEGQEREKVQLGQELHDNINQILSSSKLYMDVAMQDPNPHKLIKKSQQGIIDAIQEIRKLSKGLHPSTIVDVNLVDAIQDLINDYEQTGKLKINFDHTNFRPYATLPGLNLYLFRIVQEQVTNIIKYAQVKKAAVALESNDEFLTLTISDKGIGFDKNIKRNGIGISNILNRVTLFKGTLEVQTAPGKGCTLEIKIPINVLS
jgi:PAS domain S-box-containing protein